MSRNFIAILFLLQASTIFGQEVRILSFTEYLGYVKKYHPIVKQANLLLSESEANLLKARGLFDPKFALNYNNKEYDDIEYFNKLNAIFKIPTWYGIEFKGSFEQTSGVYLNPEANLPDNGLYNIGVSVSLAKGLLINERMATLRQAKLFQKQAAATNQLLVNEILYKATITYFKWLRAYREKEIYERFLTNAEQRFQVVKNSHTLGELPAIDTTEARIAYHNRKLSLEKANLNYIKTTLELSNFLWIDDVPVELQSNVLPDTLLSNYIDKALRLDSLVVEALLSSHPKLQALDFKKGSLEVEQRLQKNNLLPQINLQYNFLNEIPLSISSYNTSNYKFGLTVNLPLFLRKERASLKLVSYKISSVEFEKKATELDLINKLDAIQQEISSYEKQIAITSRIITDYTTLLIGEERKFEIGESSLFLINSRESKLIENNLKAVELEYLLLKSKGKLFNVLGLNL